MKTNRKGVIAFAVIISIVFSIVFAQAIPAFAAAATEKVLEVQGFENYKDDAAMKKAVEIWKDGAKIDISLSTTIKKDGKKALKILPKGANGSQTYASITVPAEKKNWTGAEGIQFYVKNVGTTFLSFQVTFTEGKGEPWTLKATGKASISTSVPGKFQEVKTEYNVITVPAGFAGLVKVPFTSFEVPSWYTGDAKNNKIELADITSWGFGFSATDNLGKQIYVDSFSITGKNLKVAAPATDKSKQPDKDAKK